MPPSLEEVVGKIRSLTSKIEPLENQLRVHLGDLGEDAAAKSTATYWELVAHADALSRIRLFTEQNFAYIEPVGLLGVTRYAFELTIWLKLMARDSAYGLVYFHELLDCQIAYFTGLGEHLKREILLLKRFANEEHALCKTRLVEAQSIEDPAARRHAMQNLYSQVTGEFDASAARTFSLYGDQARTNGYDFQAHLVETKILPSVESSRSALETEREMRGKHLPKEVEALLKVRWNWSQHAKKVGMADEYEFIYRYTSRLMHATPASLTTNQKNLTADEVSVFLKYSYIRFLDVIEMAKALLAKHAPAVDRK